MSAEPVVKQMPTFRPGTEYEQGNERRHRAQISDELGYKHDKRSDVRIGSGFALILSSPGNIDYALEFDDAGLLKASNYATGIAGQFVIDWQDVQDLEVELLALETAFEAADTALSTAYITADAVVASDAAGARAAMLTTLSAVDAGLQTQVTARATIVQLDAVEASASTARGIIASDLTAEISRATTAESGLQTDINLRATITRVDTVESDAETARATSATTIEARRTASVTNGLFTNPRFDHPSTTPGVPYGWADFALGTSATLEDKPDGLPGQCCRMTSPTDTNQGFVQFAGGLKAGQDYLISAEIKRRTGALQRSGLLLQWFDAASAYISPGIYVKFGSEAPVGGSVSSVHTGVQRWEKIVTAPTNATQCRIFVMNSYSGISGTTATPSIDWFECDIKPLTDAVATTTTLGDAFVGSDGNAIARIREEVAATGSDPGLMRLESSDGTSKYGLVATIIRLFNNVGSTTIEVMRAIGGYVFFSNPISIDKGGQRTTLGPNDDVVLWFGADTVDPPDQTIANSAFALGDDGIVYLGASAVGLTGATASLAQASVVTGASPQVTPSVTITPQGGDGTYTYAWAKVSGDTFTVTSSTAATTTFSTSADNQTDGESAIYRCTVTETSTSLKTSVDVGVFASYIAPP